MTEKETEQQTVALVENICQGSLEAAGKIMKAMHPAEIADAVESLPPARRRILWNVIDLEIEGDILMEVGDEVRESLVRNMDTAELLAATEQLDLDPLRYGEMSHSMLYCDFSDYVATCLATPTDYG